ncbi:MAG: hypothetical protein MMC33_008679 [Icmadophila ericetorum]|nr:hypothetical protein [Icmadophila ericetorum]
MTYMCVFNSLGHERVFQAMVEYCMDLNLREDNHKSDALLGKTALQLAVQVGHYATARILVNSGARIQTIDEAISLLSGACQKGYFAIVSLLLEVSGVDINVELSDGYTLFMVASAKGQTEVVRLLLGLEANVYAMSWKTETALHRASKNGHDQVIRLLIGYGAGCEAEGSEGCKPLHKALYSDHIDTYKLLLDLGAKPIDVKAAGSKRAMFRALNIGSYEAVKVLSDIGFDVNTNTKRKRGGASLLHAALKAKKSQSRIELVGARIDPKD